MSKKEKIKHYFALEKKDNDIFMKHINDNLLSKQKLLEKLVLKYLEEQKIKKKYD